MTFDAAFRRHGLIRVDDCHELYETAMLLRDRDRRPAGRNVAGMAISGGNAVQLADLGASLGLHWPDYAAGTQDRLGTYMPAIGKIANPTDLTAAAIGQKDTFGSVLEIIADDPNVHTVVPILTFASRAEITRVREFARTAPKAVAVLWSGGCNDDRALAPGFLAEAGVPAFRDAGPLLRAVSRAADYASYVPPPRRVRPPGTDPDAARAALGRGAGALTEAASKAVLATYGLPVTQDCLAADAASAVAAARAIGGPVALKVQSPDIPHKAEAGGVRLGLQGDDAVAAGFAAILAAATQYAPTAAIEGVLVQPMLPPGVELMLGTSQDPVFGPVLTVALGGIFVEVLGDVAHLPAPVGPEEAETMLRRLKGWKLLDGARGRPPAAIPAIVDAMVRLSWLAVDLGDAVAEIDINPAIASQAGLTIADALVVRR